MNLFQTVTIAAFGVLLVLTLVNMNRDRIAVRAGLMWSAIWIAGSLTVMFPDSTKILAGLLGISRGVDVLLYFALFVGLAALYGIYMRFRKVERQITILTREIAILEHLSETSRDREKTDGSMKEV